MDPAEHVGGVHRPVANGRLCRRVPVENAVFPVRLSLTEFLGNVVGPLQPAVGSRDGDDPRPLRAVRVCPRPAGDHAVAHDDRRWTVAVRVEPAADTGELPPAAEAVVETRGGVEPNEHLPTAETERARRSLDPHRPDQRRVPVGCLCRDHGWGT